MSTKFHNKYRIESTRLQKWNYGSNGKYFITICTCENEHFFGNIANEEMFLNEVGELAHNYWCEIPNHFPYIHLDEFVVMPNHVHGIVVIDDPYNRCNINSKGVDRDGINAVCTNDNNSKGNSNDCNNAINKEKDYSCSNGRDGINAVCTDEDHPKGNSNDHNNAIITEKDHSCSNDRDGMNAVCTENDRINPFCTDKNPMKSINISSIIRWYKGRVTFETHKINPKFSWHPRFYDHIIKDQDALQRIRNYIRYNPKNWKEDKYFDW